MSTNNNTRANRNAWLNTPGLQLEATELTDWWAVRPAGAVGTMGWTPVPWKVVYVSRRDARTAAHAVRFALEHMT